MKTIIKMIKYAGEFAENKDVAKKLRIEKIMPSLSKGNLIVIDFQGMSGATQSFIHALISDPIREYKDVAFNNLLYKHTSDDIKGIISIVYRYMQESLNGEIEE